MAANAPYVGQIATRRNAQAQCRGGRGSFCRSTPKACDSPRKDGHFEAATTPGRIRTAESRNELKVVRRLSKNNYFTEMNNRSEAASYLRLIDFASLNSRLES